MDMLINQMGRIFLQCICISITSSQCCTSNILHFCQLYFSKAEIKKKESTLGECIIYFSTNQFYGYSRKSFICSTWGEEQKSVNEWREVWLEANGWLSLEEGWLLQIFWGFSRREESPRGSVPTQPLRNHIKDRSSHLFLLLCTWWLEAPEQDDGVTGKDHRGGRYQPQLQEFHFGSR